VARRAARASSGPRACGACPRIAMPRASVGEMTVWENAVLERLRRPVYYQRAASSGRAAARAHATELIRTLRCARARTPDTRIRLLSGRQHAEADPGPRAGHRAEIHPRQPADPRPRRGGHRGRCTRSLLAAREAEGLGRSCSSPRNWRRLVALSDRIQAIVGKGRLSAPVSRRAQADAAAAGADDGRRLGPR
jgi:hypothetical protein